MNIHRFSALVFIFLFVNSVAVSAMRFPESIDTPDYRPGEVHRGGLQNADGNGFMISKTSDGKWLCEGINTKGQCNIPPGLETYEVRYLQNGKDFVVAHLENNTVMAWGNNDLGQCDVPKGLSDVDQVAVTEDSVAVVLLNGSVRTWGNPAYNQTRPPSLNNAVFISSGSHHYAVLTSDNKVVTWGDDSFGQSTVPSDLEGKKIIRITTGGYHTIAITEDSMVYAWGDNSRGQCTIPRDVGMVREISAGKFYSLIHLENETLLEYGSLTQWGRKTGPVSIPFVKETNFRDFETGVQENIAVTDLGEVLVWLWDDSDIIFNPPEDRQDAFLVPVQGNFGLKRISDGDILKLPARSFIYDKICSSPGMSFNNLCRTLGINRGTLRHHLNALISAREIVAKEYTGKTVYFADGKFGDTERRLLMHLKNPARRDLLQKLHTDGHLRRGDLIDRTQLSTASAAWHLKSLSDEGIVRIEKSGREAYYSLHPEIASSISGLTTSAVE